MNVTISNTNNKEKQTEVKFNIPDNWITSETRMMQRIDHVQSEIVEMYRRCMMIVTETELLREGIEKVAKTVPTYSLVQEGEEKPDVEDLEQDQEEEPKDETNNRV